MHWPFLRAAIWGLSVLALADFCHAQTISAPTPRDSNSVRLALKKKSSPRSVMFRSLVVPGWGQYYNHQYLKAALVCGAEVGLLTTAIYWNNKANAANNRDDKLFYQNNRNTANWFLLGTVILSLLDAYVDASLADFDESPDLSFTPAAARTSGVMLTIKIGL